MKSVGIRELKNKLSKYLALVREGETVLVTDRDEVIAEIHKPSPWLLSHTDPDWAVIQRLAAQGKITPAKVRGKPLMAPARKLPLKPGLQALLDEVKED